MKHVDDRQVPNPEYQILKYTKYKFVVEKLRVVFIEIILVFISKVLHLNIPFLIIPDQGEAYESNRLTPPMYKFCASGFAHDLA